MALTAIDATPSLGLRGPTNFAGWLSAEQTGQLQEELASQRWAAALGQATLYDG